MNEDAEAFAKKVAEELGKHTSEWVEDFFAALKFCPHCGDAIEGSRCWCTYDSRCYD